jgi:hypothetical protein
VIKQKFEIELSFSGSRKPMTQAQILEVMYNLSDAIEYHVEQVGIVPEDSTYLTKEVRLESGDLRIKSKYIPGEGWDSPKAVVSRGENGKH